MLVPQDIYDERIRHCQDCIRFDRHRGMCGACGCFMTIKARAAHTECPLRLWTRYSTGSLN